MTHTVEVESNGLRMAIETGKVAKQADGAVVVRLGGTVVLATCVAAKSAKESQDFFPLTVEYRERAYAEVDQRADLADRGCEVLGHQPTTIRRVGGRPP